MNKELFISTVNGIDIYAVKDDKSNFYVPVKPICTAIGVDAEGQRQRIERHYILSSTAFTLKVVAADGKVREMLCLPLEYIYGWLFTIDANMVTESKRDQVADFQRECYDALYQHFTGSLREQIESNEEEIVALRAVNEAIVNEKEAKVRRRSAEEHLARIRAQRLDSHPRLKL